MTSPPNEYQLEKDYQYLPKEESLSIPQKDLIIQLTSQSLDPQFVFITENHKNNTLSLNQHFKAFQKQLKEKNLRILQLQDFFQEIKNKFFTDKHTSDKIQIYSFIPQIEYYCQQRCISCKVQYDSIIQKQEIQIHELKRKLLESAQNNINTIFKTELLPQQTLFHQLLDFKKQIQEVVNSEIQNFRLDLKEEKYNKILQQCELILKNKFNGEQLLLQIHKKKIQSLNFFDNFLQKQFKGTLQALTSLKNTVDFHNFQEKIIKIISQFRLPQKLQPESNEDFLLLNNLKIQIERLQQTVLKKQNLIDQLKDINHELEEKITDLQFQKLRMKQLESMEEKIKQKNMRIHLLQNTIIDHISLQAHSSIELNNVNLSQQNLSRNSRVIIKKMKDQIEFLKQELDEKTIKQENLTSLQKLAPDENAESLLNDILIILIEEKKQNHENSKCQCLQLITEMVLSTLPEFQQILSTLGLIELSSNLIASQNQFIHL